MIRRLIWFVVGLILGAVPMMAFADWYQVTSAQGSNGHLVGLRYDGTLTTFANWLKPKVVFPATYNYSPSYPNAVPCAAGPIYESNANPSSGFSFYQQYCHPAYAGGTAALTGLRYYVYYTASQAPQCPVGEVFDAATGKCEPLPCQAGETGSTSVQVGWSNVWDVNARPYGVSTPTSGCSGECKVTVTGLAEQSCYLGDSGAGAPYQVLCWYSTVTTGEQCAAGDPQLSDRRDPIACPAGTSQGTIGTKTACLPSSTSETTTTTNPDGSKTETTTTTNPDGSKTETTTTKDAGGNVIGTTTTQYPAPGAPGGSGSSGTPGAGGEPQGGDDRLKECVENPEACEDGGGQFGAGAPDSSELFRRDDQVSFAGKLSKFRQDMSVTEVGQAVSGYFAVAAGGTCPTWSADIPFLQTTITIDYWCRPEMAAGMAVMKGAVLVAFGFLAFRFAVL